MEAMMSDDYVDLPYLKRQDETYFVRLWSPPKSVETKAATAAMGTSVEALRKSRINPLVMDIW